MNKFDIFVYEDMDEFDFLSCRIEKLRLWVAAVKIGKYFYQVNFYHKEIVWRYFNTGSDIFYSRPGLIIVDSLEMTELNNAVEFLMEQGYFDTLRKYKSFEDIKFYQTGASYKGKRLGTIKILPLPERE
jgi:hypothetical protein